MVMSRYPEVAGSIPVQIQLFKNFQISMQTWQFYSAVKHEAWDLTQKKYPKFVTYFPHFAFKSHTI